MAATDVIELHSGSSDEEYQEPQRKPIGWNYQGSPGNTTKPKPRPNGVSTKPVSVPANKQSEEDTDDELEVIEVKIDPQKSKASLLPASSSRSEIRKQVRNSTQSSISNFFDKKKTEDVDKRESKKEKDETKNPASGTMDKKQHEDVERAKEEEGEEEKNESTARMEEFLGRWEEIRVSRDDEKIRDKLWKHYYLAQTTYTHSKKFIEVLESSTRKLSIDNIYVLIKDILDCLKKYKDMPYKEKGSGEESVATSREGTPLPIDTEDSKANSRLRKVEKKMKEVADKIKQLEADDVDLDDEDNSSYLVEDRLKRQFTKLHDYYCRLANCSPATGRPTEKKFKYRGSRWMEINKRISAWVNKHKEFPDYVDILNLVKKVTKESSLPLRPETVRVQAQEIFREVGRMLKVRRESDDLYNIFSYVDEEEEDPATHNDGLTNQLNENEKIAVTNLDKVFQEYVDKDAEQREVVDTAKGKTSKTPTKKSPAQSPVRKAKTGENEEEEKDACKTESDNLSDIKKDLKDELSMATDESPVTVKSDDNGTEDERKDTENGDEEDMGEENMSDTEGGVTSDNGEDSSDKDNDEDTTSEEEMDDYDEKQNHEKEGTKAEEEIDDGDETDEDLKDVLASACVEEEEEEDSEEDISVLDTEEMLQLEEGDGESDNKDTTLCQGDETQEDIMLASPPAPNSTEQPSSPSAAQHNTSEQQSTPTTSPIDTSNSHQKRELEESLSPCNKRLCVSEANP